ncbi:MAG: PAS domain S-box protein, partial [Methanospirillaceae archaeon]|nr:PAS domain S-box protein [Methanospirillaceae archaeon]
MVSILIVDDEPVLLDMSKTFIERMEDYEIDTAESAIDALEMIQDRYYDVIISDYEMPVMNGISFLKEIRSREIDIPFIIFTGRGREEVAIEALNFGADYYLQKGGNNRALFAELVNFIRKTVEQKRAKNELVASEKRYRAVVECQTELISRFLPDGTHVFANEAFCRYYGIPYEKLMGRIFIPNVPGEDKKKIADHFKRLTPDNPSNIIEHRIIMPDGSVRWQQWSDLAVFNETGVVTEYQSVGRDITEKKEMEISITENLNYVKALMDTIPAPVFYRDTKGIYKDGNKAFEELVGMSREEIIGKTIHDFFPKELADHYRYKDDLIIEKPHVQQYEYLITDAKGIRYDVLFSKTALMKADGTVGGIVGVIVDISERKEIEKKLQEKLNYVKALMDTMAAPVFLRDTKGVYEDCNKAFEELVGMSREEIIGKTIHDFFPKELADHYRYKDNLIIEKPHVQQY